MNWSKWIRQIHRWLSITFAVTVVASFGGLAGESVVWLFYLPLLPLAFLLFSGLYLFVLPHAVRWRGTRRVTS
jgi:hypothetical protein